MKRFAAFAFVAVTVAASGCAPAAPPKAAPTAVLTPLASASASPDPTSLPARAHELATLTRRAIGPYAAMDDEGGLVAWVTPVERGSGQELMAVPLAHDGAPLREPRSLGQVPQEVTSLIVRPSGGPRRGWMVAWSALLDRGESLSVLGVAADATARGTPSDVQRTSDHVRWMNLVPTSRGSVCVWAEETTAGDANILAVATDPDGHVRGLPARIVQHVDGWQALRAGDGVGLSLLSLGTTDQGPSRGSLSWLRLDADARPVGAPIAIVRKPIVGGDVDAAPSGDGWTFAWTDRSGEDPQIMVARLDAAGRVDGPAPAFSAVGGSSLLALSGGPRGVAIAWDAPRARERPMRAVNLSLLADSRDASPRLLGSFDFASSAAPELTATADGFALLASARACLASESKARCAGPLVPTFIRIDAASGAIQSEPIFVGPQAHDPAALAWDLACRQGDRCLALAVPTHTPTPISAIDFARRASPFAPPVAAAAASDGPRVVGVSTLASGQTFDDVAATTLGDATVVVALSGVAEARARKGAPDSGSRIALRVYDAPSGSVTVSRAISAHPLPVGGIAVAAGGKPDDGVAVAWVAREGGDPEVDVARLDATGRPVHEARVTNAKGDASDVALVWAGDGWILAWVDSRDGQGEVYATKVDRNLKRVTRDQRITRAPGDAGGVSLALAGDVVWVAWSDPRESPSEGLADIYVTTLHAADATPAGEEVRVLATARHSRSPRIVAMPDGGALVAWIEDAPTGLEGPTDAMVARLDASERVVAAPSVIRCNESGRPVTVALAREGDGVRAITACAGPERVTLQSSSITVDGSPAAASTSLLDLDAPPSFDVALAYAGHAVVFDDVGATRADHRVRRAVIEWKR